MNKNNKTGVTGVYFDKRINKYQAQISVLGQKVRLGTYLTLSEAQRVREEKEKEFEEKGFIQTAIDVFNPNMDIYTAKILFLICACDHHITQKKEGYGFKEDFYKRLKDSKISLQNPHKSFIKLTGVWVGEDRLIMDDFIEGKSVAQIAKKFAFSRTQMDRKIVSNLKRLNFTSAFE